jgi:hypothetical protein
MTMSIGRAAFFGLAYVLALGIHGDAWRAQAPQSFSTWAVLRLRNGPNAIDIDGDGRTDLVFVAWRETANAHAYEHVAFYRSTVDEQKWQVVPFGTSGQADSDVFRTHMGADCQLRGIAIVRRPAQNRQPVTAIVAERDFGQSYADTASVKFTIYRLAHNDDGSPGLAPVYFQRDRTIEARSKYCDVNEAFASELGIHIKH